MDLGEHGHRFELGVSARSLLGPGEGLLAFDLLEPEVGILVLGDREGGREECDQDCEQKPSGHFESPSDVRREMVTGVRPNSRDPVGTNSGPTARPAQENIKKVELLECPEMGMEAIYKIEVEEFPAFILVDDKGNDFFQQLPCMRG